LDEVRAKFEREKPLRQEKEFLQRQALAVASADLAELYYLYGNAPEAEELAREACALDPQQVECRRGLAELLARQNRAAEATAVLQELRALEPENVEYLLGLAKLHKQLGQFADADAQLKAALRKEPENPQVLAALVQLHLDLRQQLPEAQRLAQRLVELQPSGPNYFLLFNVRMLSADEDGGRRALEEAIRRDPQNPIYARAAAALGTK